MSATFMRLSALAIATAVASSFVAIAPASARPDAPSGGSACDKYRKGSDAWKRCVGQNRDEMSDNELYYAGYWLARVGKYSEALGYLNAAKVQDEKVLTYIGFATRKLGDHDRAMTFYARALALNPGYTVARAYLGEAHLGRGNVAAAKAELAEIETRAGTASLDYVELARQIAAFELART